MKLHSSVYQDTPHSRHVTTRAVAAVPPAKRGPSAILASTRPRVRPNEARERDERLVPIVHLRIPLWAVARALGDRWEEKDRRKPLHLRSIRAGSSSVVRLG